MVARDLALLFWAIGIPLLPHRLASAHWSASSPMRLPSRMRSTLVGVEADVAWAKAIAGDRSIGNPSPDRPSRHTGDRGSPIRFVVVKDGGLVAGDLAYVVGAAAFVFRPCHCPSPPDACDVSQQLADANELFLAERALGDDPHQLLLQLTAVGHRCRALGPDFTDSPDRLMGLPGEPAGLQLCPLDGRPGGRSPARLARSLGGRTPSGSTSSSSFWKAARRPGAVAANRSGSLAHLAGDAGAQ